MEYENIVTAWDLMQVQSSFALQQIAIAAIEMLKNRNEPAILKTIDDRIPMQSFSDERIDRIDSKERVKFIEGLYDDCDVYEQRDIADYTCGMASQEKLKEAIDWKEQQEMLQQENESYRMERTLSAPQI